METITIGEIYKILKKPENRGVKSKIDIIAHSPSKFRLVPPDNKYYSKAPVVLCGCTPGSKKYGIAIANHNSKKQTLLFCPTCQGTFTGPFKQFPFHREGNNQHATKTKKIKKELVLG